jgi:hypothetical protein
MYIVSLTIYKFSFVGWLNSLKEKNFGIPDAIFIVEHGRWELTLLTSGRKDSIICLGCNVPFFPIIKLKELKESKEL